VSNEEKFSLDQLLGMAADHAPSSVPIPGVTVNKPLVQQEEPLRTEIKCFLDAIRQRSVPVVSLEDGRRALAVALDILARIQEHSRRAGIQSAVSSL
jgi:predicted dehydrogenase